MFSCEAIESDYEEEVDDHQRESKHFKSCLIWLEGNGSSDDEIAEVKNIPGDLDAPHLL